LSRSDNQNDPSDNQKSGDKQNPCEVRESTRSSLRYRPPLSHSECRSVLIQIVAQHGGDGYWTTLPIVSRFGDAHQRFCR
jgi:hypothetical protein